MKKSILSIIISFFLFSALQAQSVTVTSPNGGEDWRLGSSKAITWESRGITGRVNILLFRGGTRVGIVKSNLRISDGTYTWEHVGTLQDGTEVATGSDYLIKVRSLATDRADASDNPFAISPAAALGVRTATATPMAVRTSVRVRRPSGQVLYLGRTVEITWEHTNARAGQMANVSLVSYDEDCKVEESAHVKSIGETLVASGRMLWDINPAWSPTSRCVIRLSPKILGDFSPSDSEQCCQLTKIPSIRVLAPNSGEAFQRGSTVHIQWEAENTVWRIVVSTVCSGGGCEYGQKVADLPPSVREFRWKIEEWMSPGRYWVCCAIVSGSLGSYRTEVEDYSDACITIR